MKKIGIIVICVTMLHFPGEGGVYVTTVWEGDHSEFPVEKAYEYLKKYGMGMEWEMCRVLSMTAYNVKNRKTWDGIVMIADDGRSYSFLSFSVMKSGDVVPGRVSWGPSTWDKIKDRKCELPQTTLLPIFQYCRKLGLDLNKVHGIEWQMRDRSWYLFGLDITISESELLSDKSKK